MYHIESLLFWHIQYDTVCKILSNGNFYCFFAFKGKSEDLFPKYPDWMLSKKQFFLSLLKIDFDPDSSGGKSVQIIRLSPDE